MYIEVLYATNNRQMSSLTEQNITFCYPKFYVYQEIGNTEIKIK